MSLMTSLLRRETESSPRKGIAEQASMSVSRSNLHGSVSIERTLTHSPRYSDSCSRNSCVLDADVQKEAFYFSMGGEESFYDALQNKSMAEILQT